MGAVQNQLKTQMEHKTTSGIKDSLAIWVALSALIWFFVDASASVLIVLILLTGTTILILWLMVMDGRHAREQHQKAIERLEKRIEKAEQVEFDHEVNDHGFLEESIDKRFDALSASIESLKQERK